MGASGDGVTDTDVRGPVPNSQSRERRRRYTRASVSPSTALTPQKITLLRYLAECRILSLPQLALLACPSAKSARWHLRALFDAGLVEAIPVSRAALADPNAPNDATLLYGSAPNVYTLTREGLALLYEAGLISRTLRDRPLPTYGPKNSLFLAHELAVRDVRVWLERCAAQSSGWCRVLDWHDGVEAAVSLKRSTQPKKVCPDAWFVYQLGRPGETEGAPPVLVGLVEVDRGTERGSTRWQEKVQAYGALFSAGERLREVTGYRNARVLVVTPDAARRDRLAGFIAETSRSPELAGRFWLAERAAVAVPDLSAALWHQVGSGALVPLVPARYLSPAPAGSASDADTVPDARRSGASPYGDS